MLKESKPKQGKYVKAKTPKARQKQKAAIISYYIKKRAEEKRKIDLGRFIFFVFFVYFSYIIYLVVKKLNGKKYSVIKFVIKELVFMPVILFVLTMFFERIQRLNNTDYFFISDYFLRRSNYMFDEMKLIFNSIIFLTLLEMFISFKVSENYLIARIIGLLFSLIIIFISYAFVTNYNYIIVYVLRGVGIYFGQFIYLFIKQNIKFKRANALSAFLVIFMTLFFSMYQYI